MDSVTRKIVAMRQGGKLLHAVRQKLVQFTEVGVTFREIEREAQRLLKEAGVKPSFSTVPGYHWATCIMKNDALCHGIPGDQTVADGDVITIDIGCINDGYHLDTTTSFSVGSVPRTTTDFLEIGRKSLSKAMSVVGPGASVYDVSYAMEKVVTKHGYGCVYQLTGHGVGEELHMEPSIPCVAQKRDKRTILYPGMTIAVEIMYTQGSPDLVVASDGWTYTTRDHSLSAMFEETVLVTENGHEILTNQ